MARTSSPALVRGASRWRPYLVLAALAALTVCAFLLICSYGETLSAPAAPATSAPPRMPGSALLHVLVALTAIVAAGRLCAALCARLGQPPVIGEVLAGIALGPTFLGAASAHVLAPDAAPYLGVLAQVGVMLYLFGVGLELDLQPLLGRARTIVAVSHVSIMLPFLLGAALALALYPRLSHAGVPFTAFALFSGLALSVTAFPVLARILTDRGLARTELGLIALSCAAVDDVTAWCLLALVVGVVQAGGGQAGGGHGLSVVGGAVFYLIVMFVVVRPLLARVPAWRSEREGGVVLALGAMLLSSLTTEFIGIHALFGAFLLGAVMPRGGALRAQVQRMSPLVLGLLLPAFFAYTGMRTQIGLVSGAEQWLLCGAIVLVAVAGKFGGSYAAARLTGMKPRESAALGALMNTRGLMELIVLNVGLDLGVISPTLFAMMVLMALATTLMTGPALKLLKLP